MFYISCHILIQPLFHDLLSQSSVYASRRNGYNYSWLHRKFFKKNYWDDIIFTNHQRFFEQVKPCFYLVEIGIFNQPCHRQNYQNYEQPPQASQNSDFQVIFLCQKLVKCFQKKISWENIGLNRGQKIFLKILIFKVP